MQAATLLEDGVSSSQPPELAESSQAKTAKKGPLMNRRDIHRIIMPLVLSVLMVLSWLRMATSEFPVLPQKNLMLQVLMVVVLLLQPVMLLWTIIQFLDYMNWNWKAPVLVGVAKLTRMLPLWWHRVLVLLQNLKRHGRLVKWGPHEWVLDSGAWIHCTCNPWVIEDLWFHEERANPQVWIGSVRTERFQFPSVRYVARDDDDARNVVSVSQLARDHGLVTVFEPTSCHIKDKKTGKILGKGHLRNGMYILDYLRIVGQYIGDGGSSIGGERGGSRGHGGRGNNNGEGERSDGGGRGRGHGGRGNNNGEGERSDGGGRGRGHGGRDNNGENVDEDKNVKNHQDINGNEEDKKRGRRSAIGESSGKSLMGLLGLLGFVFVLCLCIAASMCTGWGTGVTVLPMDLHSLLVGLFWFPFILLLLLIALSMSMTMQSTSCKVIKQIGSLFRGRSTDREDKQEGTTRDHYVQESPDQEHNRRILFGLSRFDVTTDDPTGWRCRYLPAGAFPTSTSARRREEFLVDSGASFHATWRERILFFYPEYLQDHTKPPTRSFGGIVGSIAVKRSGYLNGDKIMLDGVLLAPESRMNLVSVGQLSIQYGVQVEMDDKEVVIKNKWDGEQVGGGKMLNNHQYVLEYFQPAGGLFAHLHTPHPKLFGRRRPCPV